MKDNSWVNKIIDGISGIFLPIINLLSAAGILKGILAILTVSGILADTSETYLVLNAMADSLFYFLPMMLAVTASKKFGANPFTAMVIVGITLYPALNVVLESGTTLHFLGLPLKGVTYHSSVIPAILAAALLCVVEKYLERWMPALIKGFMVPLLSVFVVGLVTLLVFGPMGAVIGDVLAAGYKTVYGLSPMIAGLFLGAAVQPMVIFGFHWSFILIAMNNIMISKTDTILVLMGPSVFAQAGAALAVLLKSKDKEFKSICASAMISSLFGITEPAMFGVNLPRKKPMIAVCISAGIGGAIAGISGAQAMSFAFPSLVSLPVFFGQGFGLYCVSLAAAFVIAFVLTMVMKFEVDLPKAEN